MDPKSNKSKTVHDESIMKLIKFSNNLLKKNLQRIQAIENLEVRYSVLLSSLQILFDICLEASESSLDDESREMQKVYEEFRQQIVIIQSEIGNSINWINRGKMSVE